VFHEEKETGVTHDPWVDFEGHERVIVARDERSGMHAVVAIHSTALGPALGGVRMSLYADSANPRGAALADAMRLSRAMTLKNSLAGLDHGGGKAVIFADPMNKSIDVLHAFGRMVSDLHGAYVTAGDVGMQVADMDVIGETCRWTTGRSVERGGVGDSGILTAVGVHQGMRAAASTIWGTPDLAGRTVAIVGVGKVGGRLAGHLVDEGAQVYALDPSGHALDQLRQAYPQVQPLSDVGEIFDREWDVISPNAMGGFLTRERAESVHTRLICGGANNQLATGEVGDILAERSVVYAPDFMVNCGGVIQVAEELQGADVKRARAKVLGVYETTLAVLERAQREGITPVAAAEAQALDRVNERVAAGRP